MKKFLSVVSAITLIAVFATSFSAYAADGDFVTHKSADGAYEYRIVGGNYLELTKCLLKIDGNGAKEYTIPSEIDGYEVRLLGRELYSYSGVPAQKMIIPDTVTTIGEDAFSLSDSLDEEAAWYSSDASSRLKYVEIPNSVNYIGDGAFSSNYKLKEITIPESVVYMGETVFASCFKLKKADIRANITAIKYASFDFCTSLEEVTLPKTINKLDKRAFHNCKKLKTLTVDDYTAIREIACGTDVNTKSGISKTFKLRLRATEDIRDYESDYIFTRGAVSYAYDNNITAIFDMPNKNRYYSMWSGTALKLNVEGESVSTWKSSDHSCIKVTKGGKLTMLKKGTATVTAKLKNGKTFKSKFTSRNSPTITEVKDEFDYEFKSITVKKGKWKTLKIKGKAKNINNVYKNTKIAKVDSKKSDEYIKIKGLKKGKTTLKVKVNKALTFKIKVKVK